MSEPIDWSGATALAYNEFLNRALEPIPWLEAIRKDREEWWAKQTRWFKIRYRVRTAVRVWSCDVRQRVANWIYPEGAHW